MAARATITVADEEATPVNHVFTPTNDSKDGVNVWRNMPTDGNAIGTEMLRMGFRPPANGSPMYKAEYRFWMPTLEVTSGGTGSGFIARPTVAYANQAILTFLLHERSLAQERKNLVKMCQNFLALSNPVRTSIISLEGVWG